jgi:hypothetical protein
MLKKNWAHNIARVYKSKSTNFEQSFYKYKKFIQVNGIIKI